MTCCLVTCVAPIARADFMEMVGAIDVTRPPYEADNTGRRDATAALVRAMQDAGMRMPGVFTTTDRAVQIVYLPAGTYRISDTLCFENEAVVAHRKMLAKDGPRLGGQFRRYIEGNVMLVGEGRDRTVIKLDDRCPGFQTGRVPMVRMTLRDATNQAYYNTVRDLTLDAGQGNPGAVALRFVSNNLGGMRNVLLRCGDATTPAAVGLDLTTALGGLGYLRDVTVEGFATGILVGHFHPGYTFENITLRGQHEVGMDCADKSVQIHRLRSENRVPALRNRTPAGQVVLLDAVLSGGAPTAVAIENDGYLFARDVEVAGYGRAIRNHDQEEPGPRIAEFRSHGQTIKLWPEAPDTSLRLEIRDPPAMPAERDEQWTVFDPARQDDDTAALQALIDGGAEAILVRNAPGLLRLTDTIRLRGHLRRLHGGWCTVAPENRADDGRPLFEILPGDQSVTQLEAFSLGQREHGFTDVVDRSNRPVVLKDLFLGYGHASYTNTGTGDLYLESVVSGGGDFDEKGMRQLTAWLVRDQRVWARNWNPENYLPGIALDHAQAWCLGAKIGEKWGPYLELRNGARMEMLGCVFNALRNPAEEKLGLDREGVAIKVTDSDLCFVGVDRLRDDAGEGPNAVQIVETHRGEQRQLPHAALPRRWPGEGRNRSVVIPLYRSVGAGGTEPAKP